MKMTKNFLVFALTVTLVFSGVLLAIESGGEGYSMGGILWGDINGDGRITSDDATALAQYLLNPCRLGNCNRINKRAADVNMDGRIDVADVVLIARALVGHRVTLGPAPTPIPTPTPRPTPTPIPLLNMSYRIFVNPDGGEANVSRAINVLDYIKPGFRNNLNVNLIRQSINLSNDLNMIDGCSVPENNAICDPRRCGGLLNQNGSNCHTRPHHRSAGHLMGLFSESNTNTFRFVNYRICRFDSNANPPHFEVAGLAVHGGNDMIVSLTYDFTKHLVFTAHEISHLLGARDDRCRPGEACVMNGLSFDEWCDTCLKDIASFGAK
ncbi:MAG: dockerin type I repeat-containing protein [Defluviitaleaceae bacterium]|nr:dockerin type I repeat-containing protein [Defluviitaleaceae bacterium]